MNEGDLMIAGLRLLLIGMGTVFLFLIMMVGVVRVMSAIALRLSPLEPVTGTAVAPLGDENAPELIAVISAAITRYRQANAP